MATSDFFVRIGEVLRLGVEEVLSMIGAEKLECDMGVEGGKPFDDNLLFEEEGFKCCWGCVEVGVDQSDVAGLVLVATGEVILEEGAGQGDGFNLVFVATGEVILEEEEAVDQGAADGLALVATGEVILEDEDDMEDVEEDEEGVGANGSSCVIVVTGGGWADE